MIDQLLQNLIEFIKTASPALWHTLVKQVYLEASFRLVWVVAQLAVCFVIIKFILHKIEDDDVKKLVYVLVSVIGLISFSMLTSAIMWFVNPEFYAIRWIIQSLTNGG